MAKPSEKNFTPYDEDVILVTKPSDIDPLDDDPSVLRALLSCGHVAHPDSLTSYCKTQLDAKQTELRCPECKKVWPYNEVRKLAKLTIEEQKYFEETLGKHASQLRGIKNCPKCDTFIERIDSSNLCVKCAVCSAKSGKKFEFCWQCEREWKGPRGRADRCDNELCTDNELYLLKNCKTIILESVQNVECPSIRACPTCGVLMQHNGKHCKSMTCVKCKTKFCFLCLKLAEECIKTIYCGFKKCTSDVAPRQTCIK